MRTLFLVVCMLFGDVWVAQPQQGQISKNIVFVVDKSASLNAEELSRGITVMIDLLHQSIDEINVTALAFGDNVVGWQGPTKKSNKLPANWLELPSNDGLAELDKWVREVNVDANNTSMLAAIGVAAMQKVGPITIVVITDGEYSGRNNNGTSDDNNKLLMLIINEANNNRVKEGLEPFTIGFILTFYAEENIKKEFKDLCDKNSLFYLQLEKN